MGDKLDKFSNLDESDLILEEIQKKYQKKNKIILASSLTSLLVLGTTAVIAPIISVAVNNKDNLIINNSNVSESDFVISNHEITLNGQIINQTKFISGITEKAKTMKNIVFPKKLISDVQYDIFSDNCFANNNSIETIDMTNLEKWGRVKTNVDHYELQLFSIPQYMFSHCINLKKINLPKNLRVLSNYCFRGCSSLKTINLPDSLEEIGDIAFAHTGLESLIIPKSVTKLGFGLFAMVPLKWVKISSIISNIDSDVFYETINQITIYVPTQELKQHYESLNLSNVQEIIVGEPPIN